jgi:lipooligosaccharide transport system ATP-binding protein
VNSAAPALEARGLVKSYGDKRVVDGLDLTLSAGSVLGLLGPNGAGKTTTLRMLYGFLEPDAGSIHYGGRSFREHRSESKRAIGVCTQEDTLDHDFSVRQNLEVYATYFRPGVENLARRVSELLERFDLVPFADHRVEALSGGYRQRLMLARALIHSPRVLFLDEPTTGLDPRARIDAWKLVDAVRSEGIAVILTTHYMDEAERLSDQLVVLSEGKNIGQGKPNEVIGSLLGEHVVVVTGEQREAARQLAKELGLTGEDVLGELRLPMSGKDLGAFSERLGANGFEIRRPNLEDLFLRLSEKKGGAT